MKTFFIIMFGSILIGCVVAKKSELTGVALDAKAGAIVFFEEDSSFFYVDGLNYWNEDFINKKVIVTGVLDTVVNERPVDSSGKYIQYLPLRMCIVRRAKYKLVK